MWCRSVVNRILLSLAAARRTRLQRTVRALPALSPGRVLLVRIPFGRSPSLRLLRRRLPGFVGDFNGTTSNVRAGSTRTGSMKLSLSSARQKQRHDLVSAIAGDSAGGARSSNGPPSRSWISTSRFGPPRRGDYAQRGNETVLRELGVSRHVTSSRQYYDPSAARRSAREIERARLRIHATRSPSGLSAFTLQGRMLRFKLQERSSVRCGAAPS
jgi:hypothetical protein